MDRRHLRRGGVERARERLVARLQRGEQFGADRQQVAAGQGADLAQVAKARAHHFGVDAELLVVGIDLGHRSHAGIVRTGVGGLVPAAAGRLLVPVVDAADEGRDQSNPRFAASHRLAQREQQRQVAMDAFVLENARRLDALPGGRDLDQHALAAELSIEHVKMQHAVEQRND